MEEKTKLQQEREALELEILREDVARRRADKEFKNQARKDQEKGFAEQRQKAAAMQAGCNHRKGGKDYASTQKRGDGDNYAVVKHTFPLGDTAVICTRCLFIWKHGTSAEKMPDGSPNPTGISYKEAINFPTDNTPSGSVQFGLRNIVAA